MFIHPLSEMLLTAPFRLHTVNERALWAHEDTISENDVEFTAAVDLPGITASEITLTTQTGRINLEATRRWDSDKTSTIKKSKIVRRFAVDSDTVDLSQSKAVLMDGVLRISAPKRSKVTPRTVPIMKTNFDESNEQEIQTLNDEVFSYSVDMPGVKVSDARVTVDTSSIYIDATRMRGDKKQRVVSKTLRVDPQAVDLAKLHANLSDGVLQLTAAMNPTVEPRAIPITLGTEKEYTSEVPAETIKDGKDNVAQEAPLKD